MGTLYLAQDPRLERPVAIKLLREDSAELRERFAREARTVASLRHVNIVSVFDVDEFNGQPFIAMEYIPGETLAEMIRRRAPITLTRKLQMIEDLCAGLSYAHRAGIIHRDVKPANIMVDPEGTLKILDFGIARLGTSSMTVAGTLIGTVNYMSPEQVSGQAIDSRSDIFAVGAVFYELITYKRAFSGSMTEMLVQILHRNPDPVTSVIPDLDAEVVRIINKALEKDVTKRYRDLKVMGRELVPVRMRIEAEEPDGSTIIIGNDNTIVLQPRGIQDASVAIQALLSAANAAIDANDVDAAEAALQGATTLDPSNGEIERLGARIRALAVARQSREWTLQARREMEDGALTRAGELLLRVRTETPDNPDAPSLACRRPEVSPAPRPDLRQAPARLSPRQKGGQLLLVFGLSQQHPDEPPQPSKPAPARPDSRTRAPAPRSRLQGPARARPPSAVASLPERDSEPRARPRRPWPSR